MPGNSNKIENTNYLPLILLSVGVVGLFALSWWWLSVAINDPEKQGQFGDQFGAVNALFSGLAFAGLIFTIILQKKELELQREELSDTRKELKGQKEQLEVQNKTLKIQRFESTFFHMMELQQQIVNELSTNQTEEIRKDMWEGYISFSKDYPVDQNIRGRNLFFHAFCNIIHELQVNSDGVEKLRGMKEVLEMHGSSLYEKMTTPTYFDHYFRHLYTILQFIDKENKKEARDRIFSEEELYDYAKILRATLSRHELVWLYYNGLSEYGNNKLKLLIERYSMLNNIRKDLLTCSKENREKIAQMGLTANDLKAKGFSGTDYEFFLTSEWGNKTKYHLSAFYKSVKKQEEGRKLVADWNNYLEEKRKHSINL